MPRCSAISSDSAGCVVPENSIIRFLVTISTSVRPLALPPRIGVASALAFRLGISALAIALDHPLLRTLDGERPGWDVRRDHGSRTRHGSLAQLHRRHEHRIRTHPRIVPDLRPVLAVAVVVDRDGAGTDVGPPPHLRVADVGQVWDLPALAD